MVEYSIAPCYSERVRFVRVAETVFVVDKYAKSHWGIVVQNGLRAEIAKFRRENPAKLDAGTLTGTKEGIAVYSASFDLSLPVVGFEEEARVETVRIISELSPEYKVFAA